MQPQEPGDSRNLTGRNGLRRYPYPPSYRVDRSGYVKLRTLESFVLGEPWQTCKSFLDDVTSEKLESLFPHTATVQMRFIRYTRAGLLERRRVGKEYEYGITVKGEKRWIFLAGKMGLLDPDKGNTPLEKSMAERRRSAAIGLLEKRKLVVQEKLLGLHEQ